MDISEAKEESYAGVVKFTASVFVIAFMLGHLGFDMRPIMQATTLLITSKIEAQSQGCSTEVDTDAISKLVEQNALDIKQLKLYSHPEKGSSSDR